MSIRNKLRRVPFSSFLVLQQRRYTMASDGGAVVPAGQNRRAAKRLARPSLGDEVEVRLPILLPSFAKSAWYGFAGPHPSWYLLAHIESRLRSSQLRNQLNSTQ